MKNCNGKEERMVNLNENLKKDTNMERTDTIRKSAKRKPPVIRQTLTSMYRFAKANPLLFVEDATVNKISMKNTDLSTAKFPKPVSKPSKGIKPTTVNNNLPSKANAEKTKSSLKQPVKPFTINTQLKKPNGDVLRPTKGVGQKVRFADRLKRRSRSADSYDQHSAVSCKQMASTSSLTSVHKNDDLKNLSPIAHERKVKFRTPVRQSQNFTSNTPFLKRHSTPYAHNAGHHSVSDLQERLKEWMRKRKISSNNFHHLKCFGLHKKHLEGGDDDKENVETDPVRTSYDDLRIDTPIAVYTKSEDLKTVVQNCLEDLHKLILEGYSVEQSEAWLNVIRDKYCYLDNEPQYWECRAAIEQNRNNLTSAVECLRIAIVQGAEVQSIDHSLEKLLQKFSLLNINTPKDNHAPNERDRIVKDARNVFKSSIIQFAIQERTMKRNLANADNEKKYRATPVRRSTRLTPSRYRSTPKVKICSSLRELDDSVRSNIDFHGNTELSVRFSMAEKAN
ncbi:uncharacterized protein LOC116174053 [Photinus pyralis]|nr:uncharacterized protein LOC116174053 [Photinus pyralis]